MYKYLHEHAEYSLRIIIFRAQSSTKRHKNIKQDQNEIKNFSKSRYTVDSVFSKLRYTLKLL